MQIIPLQYETNAKSPKKCITGKKIGQNENYLYWFISLFINGNAHIVRLIIPPKFCQTQLMMEQVEELRRKVFYIRSTCLFAKLNIRLVYNSNSLSSTGAWACGSRSANILLLPMTCHRLIHCSQLGYIAWTLARVDPSPSVRTTMCCTAIDMICIGVFHTFLCTRDSAAGPILLCLIYHIYYFRWTSQERHLGEMNRQLKHKVLICS